MHHFLCPFPHVQLQGQVRKSMLSMYVCQWYRFIVNAVASGARKELCFKSIFFFKKTYYFGCRVESFCISRLKMCKTVQATRQAGRYPVGVQESSSQGALALNGPHRFSPDGNGGAHTAKSCSDSNEMERLFSGPSHFSHPPDTTHTVSLWENSYI